MSRDEQAERMVSELASRLRAEAPALFGVPSPGRSTPQPPHQPSREHAPTAPDLPPLSSVLAPLESRLLEEAAERARAADPYEQRRDRLARLAPQMRSDEVVDIEECIKLAKDEGAQGNERLSRGYMAEVDQFLDDVEGAEP